MPSSRGCVIWAMPRARTVSRRKAEPDLLRSALPGLRVTLLLNIQRKRGDTTAADQLVRGFADRFWTTDWPGASRPRVFYDPRALQLVRPGGVLHAKAVGHGEQGVFVTSAT